MKYLLCLLTVLCMGAALQAQETAPRDTSFDYLDELDRFNFIVQRGILLGGSPDFAPLRTTSGSWFLGLGFKAPLKQNRIGFRIQPGIEWLRLNYNQSTEDKQFPDTVRYAFSQLHRIAYASLPVGFYYNLTVDSLRNAQIFIEAGGFAGYSIGSVLKYSDRNVLDQQVQTRISNVQDLQRLQYGLYLRAGYRRIAATFSYRLTDIFQAVEFAPGQPYPVFSRAQISLTAML